jgi:hypothetical protein
MNSVALVRIPQDDGYGPSGFTLASIFPNRKADPTAASSYHFENIDPMIQSILAAGASPLWEATYDIGGGDSWKTSGQAGLPPQNLSNWKIVVEHVLAHFNKGWDNGHTFGIKYVESFNEPCGLGGFLHCTDNTGREILVQAIQAFTEAIAEYNKTYGDTVKTVCCAEASGGGVKGSEDERNMIMQPLLQSLKANGINIDVFSYHSYFETVEDALYDAQQRASILQTTGFGNIPVWVTEWNYFYNGTTNSLLGNQPANAIAFRGSYNALIKILMQDYWNKAFLYRVSTRSFTDQQWSDAQSQHLPMIREYFDPLSGEQLSDSFSWKMLAWMENKAPERLRVVEDSPQDFSVPKALISQNADNSNFAAFIANWKEKPSDVASNALGSSPDDYGVTVTFHNVPPGSYKLQRYEVNTATTQYVPVEKKQVSPDAQGNITSASFVMPLWSYDFLTLER